MRHQQITIDRVETPSSAGVFTDPLQDNEGREGVGKNYTSTELELWQTKQRLIRSERLASLGEMTAAVLHEIKNPLTVISGYLDMELAESPDNRRTKIMKKLAEEMCVISQNVLRYSSVQTESSGYLDLNSVVQELHDLIVPVLRNVEMRINLGSNLPSVIAVAGQIEQVVMNLVLNAIDAVERNAGRLVISTGSGSVVRAVEQAEAFGQDWGLGLEMGRHEMRGEFAYIEVEDNGVGIQPHNLSRLFESFFTTKSGDSGTGLGLHIVKTIVGNWSGNILVSTKYGVGTKFRMMLPAEG